MSRTNRRVKEGFLDQKYQEERSKSEAGLKAYSLKIEEAEKRLLNRR